MKTIERYIGGSALMNREAFRLKSDGWVLAVPFGEFPHTEAGVVQVFDRAAAESIVARFRAEGRDLLVDEDHKSYDTANSSEAMAWVRDMEARDDGLWVRLALTDVGEEAVMNGRLRGLSGVWLRGDVQDIGGGRVRPLRMDSLGFTNQPNMRGPWITNRRTDNVAPGDRTRGELAAEAHVQQIAAANVLWLKNRGARYAVPFGDCLVQVRAMNLEQANLAAEGFTGADLNTYRNRLRARFAPVAEALMNRAATGEPIDTVRLSVLRQVINGALAAVNSVSSKTQAYSTVPDELDEAYTTAVKALMVGVSMTEQAARQFVESTFPELIALRDAYGEASKKSKPLANRYPEIARNTPNALAACNRLHEITDRTRLHHPDWTWARAWEHVCWMNADLVRQMSGGK